MITSQSIDAVRQQADLETVIKQVVTLKRSGPTSFKGCCPFHNEKTPSFVVNTAKGIYKCFGCGKAGDAIQFVIDHYKYEFSEAIEYLADKFNITLEYTRPANPEQKQEKDKLEAGYIAMRWAVEYFAKHLVNEAADYVYNQRKISPEIAQAFQLGYSPSGYSSLLDAAIKAGFNADILEAVGLIGKKENGGGYYDKFRDRVMFPIQNVSGKVVGFGGRWFQGEKAAAKYLNTNETAWYHKGQVLYGISQSKSAIGAADFVYLVEGYTDVLAFHQYDIKNVVSSSGTALTENQVKYLSRFTKNITIVYDGDGAGDKASLRGFEVMSKFGIHIKAVTMPKGEDPDSLAQKLGSEGLKNYLQFNTIDFVSYWLKQYEGQLYDIAVKDSVVKAINEVINLYPDNVTRELYYDGLSKLVGLDVTALKQKKVDKVNLQVDNTPLQVTWEKKILGYCIGYFLAGYDSMPIIDYLINEFSDYIWVGSETARVFGMLCTMQNVGFNYSKLIAQETGLYEFVMSMAFDTENADYAKYADDLYYMVCRLLIMDMTTKINQITNNPNLTPELLKSVQKLISERMNLAESIGLSKVFI